jgi:hypothetical protein
LATAACSGDPADVAGNYSINTTNGENGCAFQDWTVGQQQSNIPFTIVQDGGDITGTIDGVIGAFVELRLGSRVFQGSVDGNELSMTLFGTNSTTAGSCSYTINAEANANVAGDVMTGTIRYTAATNGSPECGTIENCVSVQEFNGSRPPEPAAW